MNKTLIVCALAVTGSIANAQVIFFGPNLSETFDSLANTGTSNAWSNNTTLTGWYAAQVNGTLSTYRADAGGSATGALYSYGTAGTTERALGSVSSGTPGAIMYGARITNNAGGMVQAVTISYNGEQWRNGGNTNAHKLVFEYSLNASSINDGAATWVTDTNLDFTGPVTGAAAAAVDGNTTGRVAVNSSSLQTVLSGNWNVGTDLWIRWTDVNDTGNDHGLGIDDFRFSATPVPEPVSLVAMALGVSSVAMRRRKRR